MEELQCSKCLGIPQSSGQCLTPIDYVGAGANGFVVKVSDKSNNSFALKIVPVIARSNEEQACKIKREKLFYQQLAKTEKISHLARATDSWSIENVETTVYLKWNKTIRKRLNAKALDHPSRVVKETPGEFKLCVYFVQMEYYASGNLKAWLKCNSNQCKETYTLRVKLFCDILSAVDFLHERGLMHRDICPNNIFLAKGNHRLHAVLGDFDSIVSCGEQALWPLTKVRETFTSVMGTDPYAAPEIDSGDYDKQCDLFSLGVIAINMFFNILEYNQLRYTLHKIREDNNFPPCLCPDDITFWLDILKAQLSGSSQRRMSSRKLMELIRAKYPSLYVVGFGSNALVNLKDCRCCWVKLPSMPEPKRVGFSAAECAGKLYVIGGYEINTRRASNTVQQYDTQTGWQDWTPMLEKRGWCGAAALGGRLFAVGGDDGHETLSSAEECDLETGRWAHVASMSAARWGVGVTALGNLLFAVGGRDWKSYLNSVEWYDPRAGRWIIAAPMHTPRQWLSCAALGDRLYVAGGCASGKHKASVEWFDLLANRWRCVREMGAPRAEFALAALNGQLLAVGGNTSWDEGLDTVEMYDEKQDAWSTLNVRLPWKGSCVGCVVGDVNTLC